MYIFKTQFIVNCPGSVFKLTSWSGSGFKNNYYEPGFMNTDYIYSAVCTASIKCFFYSVTFKFHSFWPRFKKKSASLIARLAKYTYFILSQKHRKNNKYTYICQIFWHIQIFREHFFQNFVQSGFNPGQCSVLDRVQKNQYGYRLVGMFRMLILEKCGCGCGCSLGHPRGCGCGCGYFLLLVFFFTNHVFCQRFFEFFPSACLPIFFAAKI